MGNGEREGVAKKFFCAMGFFCAAAAFRPLARVFEPRSFKHIDHKEHKEDAGYDARVSMARPLSVSRYF